ncbi:Uncharacterised protein [Actinomyces bovis]|uniref:CT398-like coiled coil hairpin domain-containing protein n=1 Tax=Actinomyces bovis TaxID=1658 RepID=A0ABY1VPZ6_9ACTO|nr:hypothetical protein [Actinomyces bovis]SPT54130.1 Uncharacterised protein [Actinomyces bovis]VEG53624.1 Uncharacterised protein [Actinomyces israelii]
MTSAPIAQQRRLIELQELDSKLARLAYERSHLPVLASIEKTIERLKANRRDAVVSQGALEDAKREATRVEEEVSQVVTRSATLRERLHSGAAAARDLSALQGEIDQLGRRQSALEERQLEAMEALERAQAAAAELDAAEQQIREEGRSFTATRDQEFARIDLERAEIAQRRADLAADLDHALLAEYEEVCARTGGLGAVALYGKRLDGAVEISPQELARILAAPEEQIIHAEENDVIIVRMNDPQD